MTKTEDRFTAAAWASIVAAVVFPLAFIVEGIQQAAFEVGALEFDYGIGPADFLFLGYAGLSIYVLLEFKRLMFEQYSFRRISTIIGIAVAWLIVFFGGSFLLESTLPLRMTHGDIGPPLVLTIFWIICIAVSGIIDIVLGIILIQNRRQFTTPVRVFAWTSLIMGICEATVILSFFALILVPISLIVLAFVFFQRPEEVEFV